VIFLGKHPPGHGRVFAVVRRRKGKLLTTVHVCASRSRFSGPASMGPGGDQINRRVISAEEQAIEPTFTGRIWYHLVNLQALEAPRRGAEGSVEAPLAAAGTRPPRWPGCSRVRRIIGCHDPLSWGDGNDNAAVADESSPRPLNLATVRKAWGEGSAEAQGKDSSLSGIALRR
jgi:hypothetical protein